VAIAGFGGYAVARQSLAPVARMTERAKAITADHLDERLPIENPHDEIGQLASVFNDTFRRLSASFEQLRRFTADASHELRTPLTSLRSVGEVALGRPQSPEAYRDVIGSMLEEAERLARLVDTLLVLTRGDSQRLEIHHEELDLVLCAREIVALLEVLAEERGQAIAVEGEEDVHAIAILAEERKQRIAVSGEPVLAAVDRDILRLSIVNLLDNAIKHGPEGGVIEVSVRSDPEAVVLDVHDQGQGVPAEHRDHIFDRFYRVDKARSRATGGSGLGLSIARWAALAHGGTLVLVDDGRTGATFRIRIPRSKGESV